MVRPASHSSPKPAPARKAAAAPSPAPADKTASTNSTAVVAAIATKAPTVAASAVDATSTQQATDVVSKVATTTPDAAATVVSDVTAAEPTKAANVVANIAKQQPTKAKAIVTQVANQNPVHAAKLLTTMAKKDPGTAISLAIAAVAGGGVIALINHALAARNNVAKISTTVKAVKDAKVAGTKVGTATRQVLKQDAEKQLSSEQAPLGWLGRAGSGLSVLAGLGGLVSMPGDVKAFAGKRNLVNGDAVVADGLYVLRGANDAVKLVKNSSVGFLGAKVAPALSMAVDATDAVRRVQALRGGNLTKGDVIDNATFLAGDALDAAGSGLIMTGVGLPIGAGLKIAGMGFSLLGIAESHLGAVQNFAEKATSWVGHAVSKLNPFN
ncbi:MAG TPA: hypothetical protein V6D47_17890 [Oscillatoriaceae cyanobacterium]